MENNGNEKTLTVYFSRKGYTERFAKEASRGGELLRLETTERTRGYLGFWWCGRFGMHRSEMPLAGYNIDFSKYDKIILCSPIWVFSLSAPMRRFISENAGKIHRAEYVFVHFSTPMNYKRTASCMDAVLGLDNTPYTSICCMWGRLIRKKRFGFNRNFS